MDPITNSTIKENFRCKNIDAANTQKAEIQRILNQEINNLRSVEPWGAKIKRFVKNHIFASIILILLSYGIALVIALIILVISGGNVRATDRKVEQLRQEASQKIDALFVAADQKTQREIAAYERDVNAYAKKLMDDPKDIETIIDYCTNMFLRMISHAKTDSYIRFIEADFHFLVRRDKIEFIYNSSYSNSMSDFVFKVNNFRDLNCPEACEGLAQALTKLIIRRVKKHYPPDSTNISLKHNDADVTIHFKGPNPNFVTPINIV